MYEDAIYVRKDTYKAIDWYIEGAAYNNALWFFQLSKHYLEGSLIPKNDYLHFKYLKRAAEEGYVQAQHMLAIAYHEGKYTKQDNMLSLAWFREAARNGYPLSLVNAGDLLISMELNKTSISSLNNLEGHGTEININKQKMNIGNLLFGLSQYINAYRYGAFFLEERITKIVKLLRDSGEFKKE